MTKFALTLFCVSHCVPCTVPSMPPANITANVTSSTSLTVTWKSVPDIHQNGIITQYKVQYFTESAFGGTVTVVTPASNKTTDLTGLEEYTEYSIRISAHTVVGAGPFSQPLIATTHEDGKTLDNTRHLH